MNETNEWAAMDRGSIHQSAADRVATDRVATDRVAILGQQV